MAEIVEKVTYRIPIWAASAICYGDYSGLTNDERLKVELFNLAVMVLMDNEHDTSKVYGHWNVEPNVDSYFAWRNDIDQLGGQVIDMTWIIMERTKEPNTVGKE